MSPRRKAAPQLTRLELQIMNVLWDIGPSTVLQVQKKISGESLAYTTVQTMLNIRHRKGRVRRKILGKAYVYSPVLTRDHAVREVVRDIANRLFRGSVDRKSTRLNSSHVSISYAVFCLKKKTTT